MIWMHLPSTQTPGCCPRFRFITGCGNHVAHCSLRAAADVPIGWYLSMKPCLACFPLAFMFICVTTNTAFAFTATSKWSPRKSDKIRISNVLLVFPGIIKLTHLYLFVLDVSLPVVSVAPLLVCWEWEPGWINQIKSHVYSDGFTEGRRPDRGSVMQAMKPW